VSYWETVLWQDVLTIRNGKNQKKVANKNGIYPIYGSGGVMGYADDFLCDAGATIIGRKGSINNPIYVEEKFWNVDTAFGLCAGENLHDKFFYYFCITYNFLKHNKATTLPSLTKADLLKIKIPLPPLAEQKKIAAILDAADSLRQKDQQLIEHYTALSQSLFLDMFGDPVANPMGYEKTTVGEQCFVKGGKRVPKGEKLVKEQTDYPYIKAGNIKRGKVTTKNLEYLTSETRSKINRYIVNEGDVCITVVGVNIGDVGIVPKELHQANLTENANKLLIKDNNILSNFYLSFYMQMDFIQQQIKKRTMAVGVPKLAIFRIQQLELLLPSTDLQKQFTERIEAIEKQKQQAQANLEKSEALFNSLLQRAFKGELTSKQAA